MLSPRLLLRPATLGIGLGASFAAGSYALLSARHATPLRADAPRAAPGSDGPSELQRAARSTAASSGLDVHVLRQISSGSIAGLVAGVALGVFSKPLTLVLGLLMLSVQYLESRGLHIVPYQRIQRYFSNTDVRRAMTRNVPFKLTFAATFTLAAFADF